MLNLSPDQAPTVCIIGSGYRKVEMSLSMWLLLTRESSSMRQLARAVDDYAAAAEPPKAMAAGVGR